MEFFKHLKGIFKGIIEAKNITVTALGIIFTIIFFGGLLYVLISELEQTGFFKYLKVFIEIIIVVFVVLSGFSGKRRH